MMISTSDPKHNIFKLIRYRGGKNHYYLIDLDGSSPESLHLRSEKKKKTLSSHSYFKPSNLKAKDEIKYINHTGNLLQVIQK